jgi:hypothetical protein
MAEETNSTSTNEENQDSIEITDKLVSEFVKEIITLEQDNLYVNRANIKEKIVAVAKTKVR